MNNKKIALISGGTSGVGLSLVKKLASEDYFVYFIGSNPVKGEKVENELNKKERLVEYIQLDLSDLKAVDSFCLKFCDRITHLDLLANIAGVILPKKELNKLNIEKTFAIGYLAAFILSNKLLDLLKKSKNGRIVNMGGRPSQILNRKIDFDLCVRPKGFNPVKAAFDTIHAKTVMSMKLAINLEGTNITVNSFSPGAVKSDLGQNMFFPVKMVFKFLKPFMNDYSETAYFATFSQGAGLHTGSIFIKQKAQKLDFDEIYTQKLWNKTQELLLKNI